MKINTLYKLEYSQIPFIFLKLLAQNSDREWFHDNKSLYEAGHENFVKVVQDIINVVAKFDCEIGNLNAKSTLFRIYRSLRFSPNKNPYKVNFAAALVNKKKTFDQAGYYINIQPGNCMLGGGVYITNTKSLIAIREKISTEPDNFLKIIRNKDFTDNLFFHEDKLKKIPRGFDEKDPMADYLKLKEFAIYHPIADDDVLSQSFVSQCCKIFEAAKPFNDFINNAIINYNNSINNNKY